MKGYLTTCDGAQFELPTLLKWEFSYTGSVPCDSFTLRCAYEPAMAETLRRAVRFTAREDGTVEFVRCRLDGSLVHGRRLDLVNQPRTAMGLLVPVVHEIGRAHV